MLHDGLRNGLRQQLTSCMLLSALRQGPVLVCILDGWGVNVEDEFNAVFSADTPCTDALKAVPQRYRSVKAHGTAVGLPSDADMGNSEVGHNALGSGQVCTGDV